MCYIQQFLFTNIFGQFLLRKSGGFDLSQLIELDILDEGKVGAITITIDFR